MLSENANDVTTHACLLVEQVGREFAESTTHFQDALNDVLAGGKKLF